MNLIGKNKVAEYILKHPESRIPLLIFLKEFPYRQDNYVRDIQDVFDGTFHVDGFDCIIKVQFNLFAKAINILQVTNREEDSVKWEEACKEQETKGLDLKEPTKTILVAISPPRPPDLKEIKQLEELNDNSNIVHPEVINFAPYQKVLDSDTEYEQCLNRVNAIFKVKPGVPEFEELINLLPLVFNFEEYKLKFPKLKVFELVKNRMDLFSLTSGNLGHVAGNTEELTLFLCGKRILEDRIVTQLFSILAVRSPVTDQRFL